MEKELDEIMKKINRLKYTGVIAGVGLTVIMFGSGAYANTRDTEPETEEMEVISFEEILENSSSGHGLEEEQTEGTENTGSIEEDIEIEEGIGIEGTETESTEEIGLSAGFDKAAEDIEEDAARSMKTRAAETGAEISSDVEKPEPETHWGYANLGIAHVDNHLNIRQEPNENGKLIGKLPKDAACEILDIDENGWAHIKSGKLDGYCSTEFLYLGDAAIARGHEVASMIAIVNTQTLKVREEPNTDSVVITLIPQEEELEVVEVMENGWIKFLLDDEEAYVSGEYVDVEERLEKAVTLTELLYGQGVSNVRVDLVQYAKQFVGNPYVWGGTSLTNGADCSGFTLSIYKKYGVSLPHHAASQAQLGTKIDYSSAQPGDLVFYAKNGSINHVAIYIGNGQVIHASSPKTGIKISSWNYRTPSCIRRYLSN